MNDFTKEQLEAAYQVITEIVTKCERVKLRLREGGPQASLTKNRMEALNIVLSLINNTLNIMDNQNTDNIIVYTKEVLEKSIVPINSLINKSEKVIVKLSQGSWQYVLTKKNIDALKIAKALIIKQLDNN